jgi:hypothetical protein
MTGSWYLPTAPFVVTRVVHCTVSTAVVRSVSVEVVVVGGVVYEFGEVVLSEGGGGGAEIAGEAACPMVVLIAC